MQPPILGAGIPSTIFIAASFDDAIAMTGFAIFSNLAIHDPGSGEGWDIAKGPMQVGRARARRGCIAGQQRGGGGLHAAPCVAGRCCMLPHACCPTQSTKREAILAGCASGAAAHFAEG